MTFRSILATRVCPLLLTTVALLTVIEPANAQALQRDDFFVANRKPMRLQSVAGFYAPLPITRELKENDIIKVVVNDISRVDLRSRFNRQRNSTMKSELKNFIRLDDRNNLTNAAANKPSIDASSRGTIQSKGESSDNETIQYNIAVTIRRIYPNGHLYVEGEKWVRTSTDYWKYTLSGRVDPTTITPAKSVNSDDILFLHIEKRQQGKVYDSTKRSWGTVLVDTLFPF
jgi:flagellar L-ring protein precursor FlgH